MQTTYTRREILKILGLTGTALLLPRSLLSNSFEEEVFSKAAFGNFNWGVATASYQIEGAWDKDDKGLSNWDVFTHATGKIKDRSSGDTACDFYNKYPEDIQLIKDLGFDVFRFSLSWSRILPNGTGIKNQKGIDFYNRVIDTCLEKGVEPWVTLYHWDLPQALEDKGGWTNRDILGWFSDYTELCAKEFGDRVNNWMVLNEPLGFTSLGYMIGIHAPGKIGFGNFMPAVHHAALCQSVGGRILRNILPNAKIGTTFSCSPVTPLNNSERHIKAAKRLDALFNRTFIEPALGLGYPTADLPLLKKIEKYMKPGDDKLLPFEFDYIGLQNYFKTTAKFSLFPPVIWANNVPADPKVAEITEMNWEVYPEGIYNIIKQFAKYPIKEIIITESGAAFADKLENGKINDIQRIKYFQNYLKYVLKAKNEGCNVTGYLVWTLMDNFEWAEGYRPKFGIVHNDPLTQTRTIKDSGLWFQEFLK